MTILNNLIETPFHLCLISTFRAKRQHHHGRHGSGGSGLQQQDYGNAQSTAQSDSHSQGFGPNGFNNANALANAQGELHLLIVELIIVS